MYSHYRAEFHVNFLKLLYNVVFPTHFLRVRNLIFNAVIGKIGKVHVPTFFLTRVIACNTIQIVCMQLDIRYLFTLK